MFRGAQIGANFSLTGTTLARSPGGKAVNLERANIGGDLLVNMHETVSKKGVERVASTVLGSIILFNASIKGSVVFQNASIDWITIRPPR